ncbi:hypothetical protein TNCV_2019871 [Trichonephila clavipes]|nr:hypothetical protein TNCV_2019871 [Trichonephila clavipes]
MPLDNKCRNGLVALPPPHAYALVMSIETKSGFLAENRRPPVGQTPVCPGSEKNAIDTAYDVGSAIGVLMVTGSLYLRESGSHLRMVSLDTTRCLEGDKCIEPIPATLLSKDVATLIISRSLHAFVYLGCTDPP